MQCGHQTQIVKSMARILTSVSLLVSIAVVTSSPEAGQRYATTPMTPTPTPFHHQDEVRAKGGQGESRPRLDFEGWRGEQATRQRGDFFVFSLTRRTSVFIRTSLRRRCSRPLALSK